ncbi:MAG: SBBP repeat-containing protein [Chloroflexia bacterium]
MLVGAHRSGSRQRSLPRSAISLLVLLVMLVGATPYTVRKPDALASQPSGPAPGVQSYDPAKLPLSFEPAGRREGSPDAYVAHQPGAALLFTASGVALSFSGASNKASAVTLDFAGESPSAHLKGGEMLPGTANYLLGSDPSQWRTSLPTYSRLTYSGLYTGIDLSYSGTPGHLDSTFTAARNADPARLKWRIGGTGGLSIDASGSLQIALPGSTAGDRPAWTLTLPAPTAWQDTAGRREPVKATYSMAPDGTVGFDLAAYDRSQPLTIRSTWLYAAAPGQSPPFRAENSTLAYSTYLGGSQVEIGYGIAADASGNVYVTGYTGSTDYPLRGPIQPNLRGGIDVFVSKLSPDGSTLIYSTYLGGGSLDMGFGIAVGAQGQAYVAGRTNSSNFPVRDPFQPSLHGDEDAFVAELDPSGSSLVYSTYLGGSVASGNCGMERASGVAVDAQGSAYVVGITCNSDFPTAAAIQPTYGGGTNDGFVTKFSPSGQALVYSTYLGGGAGFSGEDAARGVAVDAEGQAYVVGYTTSSDFPTANAFQPDYGGGEDEATITKFNATGSDFIYSTYLGGNDTFGDFGNAIAVDSQGNAYVTGLASSPDFPVLNAFQPMLRGDMNAFVTKFAPGGQAVYSTFLGGSSSISGFNEGFGIAVDAQGSAYVTGKTGTSDFPTLDAVQPHLAGFTDGFLTRFDPSGRTLAYSTYLGGSGQDEAYGVAFAQDSAFITGYTFSANFPTAHAFQPGLAGSFDSFVARIADDSGSTPTPTRTPAASDTPTRAPTPPPSHTPTPTSTRTPDPSPTLTLTAAPTACIAVFSDVQPEDYFYEPVRYLYCHGAISGYLDGTFRPYNLTTRGQLAKIVVLAEGWTLYTPPSPTFNDVPPANAFYSYIESAYSRGIISGYSCGAGCLEYRPGNNVTRGQLCKIVVLAEGWLATLPQQPTFQDVPATHAFYGYIETAYSHGIISGYSCGAGCLEFHPGDNATRGQIAKIVYLAVVAP